MIKNLQTMLIMLLCIFSTNFVFAQPANDNCADAIAIGEVTDEAFDTSMATTDGPNHPDDCQSAGATPDSLYKDIWYAYTASFTGLAEWNICGTADFDTKIAVYNVGATCPVTNDDLYACNEDAGTCANSTSIVTFDVAMGETYLLRLGGYGDGGPGESGTGTFTISETDPPPPAPDNNLCENAIEVMVGENQAFNTTDATTTGPEHPTASCFAFGDDFVNDDIFYTFTAPNNATYFWTTCGMVGFDTRMAVYNAGATCPLTDGDLLVCNDDGLDELGNPCPGFTSNLTFNGEAGQTYILRLGGYLAGDQGAGTFDLIETDPIIPPDNDDCATSSETGTIVSITEADMGIGLIEGTTINGTQDGAVPPCINNGELFDVWYDFTTGPVDTTIYTRLTALTPSAAFILEVYEDCTTPALDTASGGDISLTCVAYAEDFNFDEDTISGLTPNTQYYLRISTVITFETPGDFWLQLVREDILESVNDQFTLENVRLFPNPVKEMAAVELDLEESAVTNIEVINSVGQNVFTQNEGTLSTGRHLLEVNTKDYSPGIYFLRVTAGEKQRVLKFIKQ